MKPHEIEHHADLFRTRFDAVRAEIAKVIVGNDDVVGGIVGCLLAGGHGLLEGIPGVGKTKLVQTVADAMDLRFARIQFTPDLMPADITGSEVMREGSDGARVMQFETGPIFANLILADEINRATPRTQSALLEVMQEGSVTVGKTTHILEQPVCVLATQNPVELEGTYPLPEAQLDRFLYKLHVGYPTPEALRSILERSATATPPRASHVLSRNDVIEMRDVARAVPLGAPVLDYVLRLVFATQPRDAQALPEVRRYVRSGASPRGAQALVLGARVHALANGRVHVAGEDVRAVLMPALRHRLLLNYEAEADGIDQDAILARLVAAVAEPRSTS